MDGGKVPVNMKFLMLPDGFPKLLGLFPSPQVVNIRVDYCWLHWCYECSARAGGVGLLPTSLFHPLSPA